MKTIQLTDKEIELVEMCLLTTQREFNQYTKLTEGKDAQFYRECIERIKSLRTKFQKMKEIAKCKWIIIDYENNRTD